MQPSTRDQQLRWMAQWRSAAVAPERVRRDELHRVDHRAVVAEFDDAFNLVSRALVAIPTSGLVEQQRYCSRLAR